MRDAIVVPNATVEQTEETLEQAKRIQADCRQQFPQGCLEKCALDTLIKNGGKRWNINN